MSSKFAELAPAFSPDGRFIAYVSNESGRQEVYLLSYPSGAGQTLVSTDRGTEPLWAHSGRELFYRHGDEMRVVDVVLAPELELSRPRTLFEGHSHCRRPAELRRFLGRPALLEGGKVGRPAHAG